MNTNLSMLSSYRTQLMGIATIMIIACHANVMIPELPHAVRAVLNYGNLGVDIFLLLSGLGCYFSLSKHGNVIDFWKRRVSRLLIPYIIITMPFALVYVIVGRDSFLDLVFCLTTMEFWLYHKGAWFVSAMIPIYLLSPLLYRLIRLGGVKNRAWLSYSL